MAKEGGGKEAAVRLGGKAGKQLREEEAPAMGKRECRELASGRAGATLVFRKSSARSLGVPRDR